MARLKLLVVLAGVMAAAASPAAAGQTQVAAADFTAPAKDIAAAGKDKTDDEAAKAFPAVVNRPEGRAIFEKYGYSLA